MGNNGPNAGRTRGAGRHDLTFLPSPDSVVGQHYYYVTLRFWPSLVFIFPLLLVYEVGSWLRHGTPAEAPNDLVAAYLVERLVNLCGGTAFLFLPALLAVAILLACHLVARHPWKFDVWVLAGMLGESLIWTLPLFVLDRALHTAELAGGGPGQSVWLDKVIRSFGVGIYEELVFRLICMNILHLLLVDLLRLPRPASSAFVIFASAIIFAAMHHGPLGAEPFDTVKFTFRTAAGLYLAGLFFYRGFGIAAGCHAFYNVIVVTLEAIHT